MFSEIGLRNSDFSWENMLSLAVASKYSYKNKDVLQNIAKNEWGMDVSGHADVSDTQVYTLESEKVLVVAYRGTESIGDWLTNVKVFGKGGALGTVHKGFLESFEDTASVVVPIMETAHAKNKTIWLTGHSLGGAAAMMAAIETAGDMDISGLATFGQPRSAKRSIASKVEAAIGQRYFRFVNDGDVVPRVPLSYGHMGQLYHFDGYGHLYEKHAEMSGQEDISSEAPPLNEAELKLLRDDIQRIRQTIDLEAESDMMVEGAFGNLFDNTLGSLFPKISDHGIDKYIAAVRKQLTSLAHEAIVLETRSIETVFVSEHLSESAAFPQAAPDVWTADDMGAELEMAVPAGSPAGSPATTQSAEHPLLLELSNPNWKPPKGLEVCSRHRRIATVIANEKQLQDLAKDSDIAWIEHSRDAGILELDTSIAFAGGDAVQAPDIGETGDGAIVGVVDTGIDVLHNAFMNADGTATRILGFWDQRDSAGPSPHKVNPNIWSQNYGTLHTGSDLNTVITAYQNNNEPASFRLRDPSMHGTHVACIAAGRKSDELSPGMAPNASILVVAPHLSPEEDAPRSIGYSNSHVDALAFLQSAAAGKNELVEERMPIAINVSLGMNAGAHDGSTLLEAAFDSATNLGRDPGVVIVKSAGNERNHAGHARVEAPPGGIVEIKWTSKHKTRREDYFEAWFGQFDDLAFWLIDPNGRRSKQVNFEDDSVSEVLGGNICSMSLTRGYRDNGANRLTLRITPREEPIQDGTWKLEVYGRRVGAADNGAVDIWVERSRERAIKFNTHLEAMTLSVPGTARTVVTVGACSAQTPWRLNDSSSYGPTRTGEFKPDLCASGFEIKAARAGTDNHDETVGMSGTSMAAPHVTGALALVMSHISKKPGARMPNAVQLRTALQRTVKGGIGTYHPGSGFGVLDAKALFDAIDQQQS